MNKVVKVLATSILIILMLSITACEVSSVPPPVSPAPSPQSPPPTVSPPSSPASSQWELLPPPYHLPRYLPEPYVPPVPGAPPSPPIPPTPPPPIAPPPPGFTGIEGRIFLQGYEQLDLPPWYYGMILVVGGMGKEPYGKSYRYGESIIIIQPYTYAVPGHIFRLPVEFPTGKPGEPLFFFAPKVSIWLPGWTEVQYENIPVEEGQITRLPDTILIRLPAAKFSATIIYTWTDGAWERRTPKYEFER